MSGDFDPAAVAAADQDLARLNRLLDAMLAIAINRTIKGGPVTFTRHEFACPVIVDQVKMFFYVCDDCGALVGDQTQHRVWHVNTIGGLQSSADQSTRGDDSRRGGR